MFGWNAGRPARLVGLLVLTMAGVLAATATPTAAAPPRQASPDNGLTALVNLASERLLLADQVAAAKFGTATPIEDPAREQQVLDQAAALATRAGLDTQTTVTFFRAQIEMSKAVQRRLFDWWTAHPDTAPAERPDLATEVRPKLDQITLGFIDQLVATATLRGHTPRCRLSLLVAERSANNTFRLDILHSHALRGAVEPICDGGGIKPSR